MKERDENTFARFFNQGDYITLKNQLFNYRFRKYMLARAYTKYTSKNVKNILLDLGCGISHVSPCPNQTTFIDSDKNAIGLLKKLGHKTLKGNVNNIPFGKSTVDAIFCSEVLEHVHNYKIAIKEFFRVLRKDGLLFITVPTHIKYWSFDDDYVGHLRRFNPKKLAREIGAEGFDILENKPIGSLLERELTKFLVRKAIKSSQKPMNFGKVKLKLFNVVNKFLFGIIYVTHLLNNSKNSSIVLIVARKKSIS